MTVPASAEARRKPDLEPAKAKIIGKNYAFAGKRADIEVRDTTENTGRAAAGRTLNDLLIIHDTEDPLAGYTRGVPRLGRGDSDTGSGTAHIDIPDGAKLGKYQALLCVDGKNQEREENEGNNCEKLGAFFIVQRAWTGSINGVYDSSGLIERARASDARFVFKEQILGGTFDYNLAQATVTYTFSGSVGTCTYNGSGVDTNPPGNLRLIYSSTGVYNGRVTKNTAFSYPIIKECSGQPPRTEYGPYSPVPLDTGTPALPFGTQTLKGAYGNGYGNTWTWDLG